MRSLDDHELALAESPAPALDGPDASGLAERLDLIEAVRRLPESQREVLVLHHFVGLTIPEVARLLGKHQRAVYSLQTRAIKGIRRCLDDGGIRRMTPASGSGVLARPAAGVYRIALPPECSALSAEQS